MSLPVALLANLVASLCGLVVKNPPSMQETQQMWVRPLVGEDPLEKEISASSGILNWKIPLTD